MQCLANALFLRCWYELRGKVNLMLLKPTGSTHVFKIGGQHMHQLINKAAVTVIPKESFIIWVQSTDAETADIPDEFILSYSRMYLVDDSLAGNHQAGACGVVHG